MQVLLLVHLDEVSCPHVNLVSYLLTLLLDDVIHLIQGQLPYFLHGRLAREHLLNRIQINLLWLLLLLFDCVEHVHLAEEEFELIAANCCIIVVPIEQIKVQLVRVRRRLHVCIVPRLSHFLLALSDIYDFAEFVLVTKYLMLPDIDLSVMTEASVALDSILILHQWMVRVLR